MSKPHLDPTTGLLHLNGSPTDKALPTVDKSASPHPFLTDTDGGGGLHTPRRNELADPYRDSPWVFAGINLIKGPLLSLPLTWSRPDRTGEPVDYTDPALASFLRCPARNHSGYLNEATFRDLLITHRILFGNAFVLLPAEWEAPRPTPRTRPIPILADPSHMTALRDGDGYLLAWRYDGFHNARDTDRLYPPERVLHWRSYNSQDHIVGMPEWFPARVDAAADQASATFAKNLAQNNGDRGDFVIAEDWLTDDQQTQVKAIMRRKRNMNRRGDYEPLILGGIKDIKSPTLAATSADFTNQRLQNRHVVAITLGIPPSMFDIVASYSIGANSDYLRLILNTCMPYGEGLEDLYQQLATAYESGVTPRLSAKLNNDLTATLDWPSNPIIAEVRREKISSAKTLWESGVPWDVASDYLNLDLPTFPGSDRATLPFNRVPVVADTPAPAPAPTPPPQDPIDNVLKGIDKAFTSHRSADAPSAPPTPSHTKAQDKAREQLRAQHEATRQLYERAFAKATKRTFYSLRSHTLAELARYAPTREKALSSQLKDKGLAELLISVADLASNLIQGLGPITQNAVRQAALEEWETLAQQPDSPNSPHETADGTDPLSDTVSNALLTRRNRMADLADDLHLALLEEINEGLTNQETTADIEQRIRGFFKDEESARVRTIAITETTFATEVGRTEARARANVKFKEWLTSDDAKVRHSHNAVDGQIVPNDQPFQLGGGIQLMHPGEDGGPPQEVINCRCSSIASQGPPRPNLNS